MHHAERARALAARARVPATAAIGRQRAAPRLDAEADVAAAAHEGAGARIDEPRPRQDAVEVLQESREVVGRPRATDAADRQQRDAIAALADREAADVVVVQDGEVRRADAFRRRRRRRRAGGGDAEPLAAAREGRGAGIDAPAADQAAVVVLEELAEEFRGIRAAER